MKILFMIKKDVCKFMCMFFFGVVEVEFDK